MLQPTIVLELLKLTLKFPKNEFCGYALFELFGNPFEEQVVLHHFVPLNVGTAGTTNYNESGEISEFRLMNPELAHYRLGTVKIHSHHSLNVFYSGTDQSDLEKNAEGTDIYFSLVVNNNLEFYGKACRIVECAPSEKTYTFVVNNQKQEMTFVQPARKEKIIQDCDIEILHSYPKWFMEYFNKLEIPKPPVFNNHWNNPVQPKQLGIPAWFKDEDKPETFEDEIYEMFNISYKVKDLVKYFKSGQKIDSQAMYDSLEELPVNEQDVFFIDLGKWITENKLEETPFAFQVKDFVTFVENGITETI